MNKLIATSVSLLLLAACNSTPPVVENTELPPFPPTEEVIDPVETYTGPLLTGKHTVVLATTKGDITLELNADSAPMSVTNFIELAKQGYYDGTSFHRVIADFMIQGGDPDGNGTGGSSIFGPTFKDEINPASYGLDTLKLADAEDAGQLPDELKDKTVQEFYELQGYVYDSSLTSLPMDRGAIAMANRGPNTNGSQFFIIQKEGGTPWLEGRHTVFGMVTGGMDIVDAIASSEADPQDKPLEPITFTVKLSDADMADTMIKEESMMKDDAMIKEESMMKDE